MGWISWLLTVAIFVAIWWVQRRRFQRDWQQLTGLVDRLGTGSGAVPEVKFHDWLRFEPLARRISDMGAANLQLREQAAREEFNFRTILSSMQEGVMVVDAQHVIRLVNPSFRQLFDVKQEPVGETVLVVLRDVVFEEIVTAALRTGDPQVREVSRNGSKPLRHFDINAVSMRDSAGQAAVVMIFRDISRLKQLEDVRREFVANVSHELRTPLSIFHGYLETILDQPKMPRQETREILEIMRKHSLRLNALLEDLLILARLESRGERLRLEAIDIAKFAPEIAADWALPSSQKKIAIDVQVEPGLPPLRADSLRLAQVLNNLIGNALNYTDSGGQVALRAKMDGDQMEIRVEDNGIGIPPGDLPHIFERFYRADKARSRDQGGTGLGLSIVKHIVQTHGGAVRAESTYGKGTTIMLRLPVETNGA